MNLRHKTQYIQDNQHLCVDIINQLTQLQKQQQQNPQVSKIDMDLLTNFGIIVNHPFAFVLLHLRNKTNKYPIHVNIPEVCIFYDKNPYDVVYAHKGFIRGQKHQENTRIKLKQINKIFKEAAVQNNLPKNQPCIAVLAQQQIQMLTDNDLFLTTFKSKTDPFFKKLRYIRNKLPSNTSIPIYSYFDIKYQDVTIIKLATSSLMGFHREQQIMEKLLKEGQSRYLLYLNQKIVLTLNYQHNIRISRGSFVYMKTLDGRYYLINVKNLSFTNLTHSIIDRERRLKQKQQQRNKILIMTPQKQAKYKSLQNKKLVKIYEQIMNNQFNNMLIKMNLNNFQQSGKQQIKNEQAFKKLHPNSKFTIAKLITSNNFIKTKNKALQIQSRKPITIPSRYVMRYYNNFKHHRFYTQDIQNDTLQ